MRKVGLVVDHLAAVQVLWRVDLAVVEEVRERLRDATGVTVHDVDGVRVVSEDGWWLLRASNTQDVLVARCEAWDVGGLARLKEALAAQLSESGIAAPENL